MPKKQSKKPAASRYDPSRTYTTVEPITLSGTAMERLRDRATSQAVPLCRVMSEVLEEATRMQLGAETHPERPEPDWNSIFGGETPQS